MRRYVRELSPDSRTRLLRAFAAEADEFAHLVFRIVETLQLYHAHNKTHDPNEPKQAAFALMTKGGNGLLVLTAADSYTGSTVVSGGTLQLNVANAANGG